MSENYNDKGKEIQNFDNWLLTSGWLLNTVPFNTGSTAKYCLNYWTRVV